MCVCVFVQLEAWDIFIHAEKKNEQTDALSFQQRYEFTCRHLLPAPHYWAKATGMQWMHHAYSNSRRSIRTRGFHCDNVCAFDVNEKSCHTITQNGFGAPSAPSAARVRTTNNKKSKTPWTRKRKKLCRNEQWVVSIASVHRLARDRPLHTRCVRPMIQISSQHPAMCSPYHCRQSHCLQPHQMQPQLQVGEKWFVCFAIDFRFANSARFTHSIGNTLNSIPAFCVRLISIDCHARSSITTIWCHFDGCKQLVWIKNSPKLSASANVRRANCTNLDNAYNYASRKSFVRTLNAIALGTTVQHKLPGSLYAAHFTYLL